jgi:hypothetical protein
MMLLLFNKRNEFQHAYLKPLKLIYRGLVLEQLLIRNINLPASVKASSKVKLTQSKMRKK